jgi:hypothetical protein
MYVCIYMYMTLRFGDFALITWVENLYIYMWVNVCMHIYIYMCVYVYIYVYMYIYIYIYTEPYKYIYISIFIGKGIQQMRPGSGTRLQ